MTRIPDFTETELWVVHSTLKERYGRDVELSFAESETRVDPDSTELAWRPTLFWSQKGANFVIVKTDAKRFRTIFYYHPGHQVGSGHEYYDEIGDCVVSVQQVESDHIRGRKIDADREPVATDKLKAPDSPNYSPLFWGDYPRWPKQDP